MGGGLGNSTKAAVGGAGLGVVVGSSAVGDGAGATVGGAGLGAVVGSSAVGGSVGTRDGCGSAVAAGAGMVGDNRAAVGAGDAGTSAAAGACAPPHALNINNSASANPRRARN